MTRCLFMGGPHDGEWCYVDTDAAVWCLSWRPDTQSTLTPTSNVDLPSLDNHRYTRYPVVDGRDTTPTFVYVHESWHGRGVLRALLNGYKRST